MRFIVQFVLKPTNIKRDFFYPPDKAPDMAKLYLKQPRDIPFVTKWRAFNAAGGLKGNKQYHLILRTKIAIVSIISRKKN